MEGRTSGLGERKVFWGELKWLCAWRTFKRKPHHALHKCRIPWHRALRPDATSTDPERNSAAMISTSHLPILASTWRSIEWSSSRAKVNIKSQQKTLNLNEFSVRAVRCTLQVSSGLRKLDVWKWSSGVNGWIPTREWRSDTGKSKKNELRKTPHNV